MTDTVSGYYYLPIILYTSTELRSWLRCRFPLTKTAAPPANAVQSAKLLRLLQRTAGGVARFLSGARLAALVLLGVLTWVHWLNPVPVEIVRTRVFDLYQNLRPRPALEESPVVIVDIDEKSLAAYGQWPWPRTLVAQLVLALKNAGVRAIGFDIVFAEGDRTSPEYASRFMAGLDDPTFEKLQALPRNDAILGEQLRGANVVLGQSVTSDMPGTQRDPPRTTSVNTIGDVADFVPNLPFLIRNIGDLEATASGRGVFSLLSERDGIVRRVPSAMRVGNVIHPALSLELLRVVLGRKSIDIRARTALGIDALRVPPFVIPTDRLGRMWVYYAPRDTLRTYSIHDILIGATGADKLRNRIVLIGTSAAGLLDIRATPLDGLVPGVEVHAQLLDMILSQNYLYRPGWALPAEILATAFAGLLMTLLVPALGALPALIAGVMAAGILSGGSWFLFSRHGMLLDPTWSIITVGLVFGLLVFWAYFREETERRRLRGAFAQYLSPALVERLVREPGQLKLGGETRDMTMLFCDVRGFTTISEQYKSDPQGLTSLINRLLTPLSRAILDRNGTIDKYMGDNIMAFWNAPIDDTDHRAHACEAALALHEALADLNTERAAEAAAAGSGEYVPLRVGVGINTGAAVVGNMGSDMRFDYSVLGDAVNLAARLEHQSKVYGVDTVIGEETAQALDGRFALLELDLIAVRGKTEGVRIFALMGGSDRAATPEFREWQARNGEMLAAYRAQDWARAEALARELRANGDTSAGVYYDLFLERFAEFRENPPPPDWNGVHVATTK